MMRLVGGLVRTAYLVMGILCFQRVVETVVLCYDKHNDLKWQENRG